jgi:hypothetical protein
MRGQVAGTLELDGEPDAPVCVQIANAAVIVSAESLALALRCETPGTDGRDRYAVELRFIGGPVVEIAEDGAGHAPGGAVDA